MDILSIIVLGLCAFVIIINFGFLVYWIKNA